MGGNQIPGADPTIRRTKSPQSVDIWIAGKIITHYTKNMKSSWLTKLSGIASLLTLWSNTLVMLTDGNPATNPDWSLVITATMAAIGVIAARQNNVTSEDAGIKGLR